LIEWRSSFGIKKKRPPFDGPSLWFQYLKTATRSIAQGTVDSAPRALIDSLERWRNRTYRTFLHFRANLWSGRNISIHEGTDT
jgi:hypothetical protein